MERIHCQEVRMAGNGSVEMTLSVLLYDMGCRENCPSRVSRSRFLRGSMSLAISNLSQSCPTVSFLYKTKKVEKYIALFAFCLFRGYVTCTALFDHAGTQTQIQNSTDECFFCYLHSAPPGFRLLPFTVSLSELRSTI